MDKNHPIFGILFIEKKLKLPKKFQQHKHILKQKNIFNATELKCKKCNLKFQWNVKNQEYQQVM